MARYCSIITRRKLTSTINNTLNSHERELLELCLNNEKNSTNFWHKLSKTVSKFQTKTASTFIQSRKQQFINDKQPLPKQIQKLCTNLQKNLRINFLPAATLTGVSSNPQPIPDPPPIPQPVPDTPDLELLTQLNPLGEPTFASLGLGGYSPVGLVQQCFEYLHGTLGVEWWLAIALGTLVVRILLFPLVIMAQRNAAKMNNYLPQMQLLQLKMTEARQTGNQMEAARYSQEMMLFMKEKGLNPFKNMVVPLAQMPVFISFFMGLRQMANVPVESLRTGGIFWFTDLTLPDQYFLLPIITSATLYATIELGTDTAKLSSQNMQVMRYVLRGMPLIILPFTFNFPGAILCYWVSSNFISLLQVGFLRIPTVRNYFNIEPMRRFAEEEMPLKPKGFRAGLKDSWENIKITKQLEDRKRLDELAFQRAGKGPLVKTYKYDPTKTTTPASSSSASTVQAKSR